MALTQISTAGVKDDAVTAGKIPANAVGSSELADNAVDTAAIADDAVTDAKLANSINTAIAANTAKVQTTINSNADNRVITGSGTANTLNGESSLTYDGSDLNVSNDVPQLLLTDTNSNSSIGRVRGNAGNLILSADTNNATAGSIINFEIDGSERLRVDSSGRVGIGTASPDTLVHVKNTSASPLQRFESSSYSSFIGTAQANDNAGNGSKAGNLVLRGQTGVAIMGNNGTTTQVKIDADGLKFGTDTAAANALDDYEEGSWTPVIQGSGSNNSKTYSYQAGHYTKVGRLVTCSYRVAWTANSGDSGNALISGLPFTINEATASGGAFTSKNLNFPSGMMVATTETAENQTFVYFLFGFDSATWDNPSTGLYQSTGGIRGQFHYITNS